jgi:hypothetical protein
MWWLSATKALPVGFVAYAAGFTLQGADNCTIPGECPGSATPSDAQILAFSAVVFVTAFCFFFIRAWRRKLEWRP